ncbi:MAG: ABC transporter ATP-binding protein [Chloroflexi bacterium]|nr:ABC transporter ATP-binding protein [Chloroflexota bacterium]MBP8058747.1 ABC transporter ATP-binding protein [Chloroflexota bacterium]
MNSPAIHVENLERVYHAAAAPVYALRGITLSIAAGQFIALKGRSGSGKTTLLNCIGGLDQPTAGTITVYGRSLNGLNDQALTEWRQREVGFIFQSFGLLPTLSAYENVELMLRIAQMPRRERAQRARQCLELVGLGKWADHRPYEMSGGQQQRVAIARAIANKPRLLLADEATGELDSETAREILALFQAIVKREGFTILLASHDSLVDGYVDDVVHLADGRIMTEIT